MKISYDSVSRDYTYPLSRNDIAMLKNVIPHDVMSCIRSIKCGCNTKTTQEGRTVQYGNVYDLRINFCLNKSRSLVLSTDKAYINEIRQFGGEIDLTSMIVTWELPNARRYAFFVLLHEIGHVAFCIYHLNGKLQGRSTAAEEQWCDKYALGKLEELLDAKPEEKSVTR